MLPAAVQEMLTAHLEHVRQRHQHDLGKASVGSLCRMRCNGNIHTPTANPAGLSGPAILSLDPRSGERRRHPDQIDAPTSCQRGRAQHRPDQASQLSHAPPFVRYISPREEDDYDIRTIQDTPGMRM